MAVTPERESDLIERARHGDVSAFESLVRAHQEVAFRTAWVCSGGTDDAEDAAQEAFMKAFAALPRFRAGAEFRPWLLTIVANEARNRRRSANRREALAVRAPADGVDSSPEATAVATEQRRTLLDAINRLPDVDREVVTYRYLLELSEAEAAAVLGLPVGTVKSRLSRALDRLRSLMGAA
ncbi:MAG TPA: sigma-70 family RNA polymerase sigma factor [Candidatus Limnocylindria bacterium]|nr:sigma-70 family RNA polymerase sigma factor [Candidatus Limnocylindria bacterium]